MGANQINFSNTTPAAPTGATNVMWQGDASVPENISAYVILPATVAVTAHQYLVAYNATTGTFSQAQPSYSDLTGTPTLPASQPVVANKYVTGYNATTGAFTLAQPAYSALSGLPTLPANQAAAAGKYLTAYNSSTGAFTATALVAAEIPSSLNATTFTGVATLSAGGVLSGSYTGNPTFADNVTFSGGPLTTTHSGPLGALVSAPKTSANAATLAFNVVGGTSSPQYEACIVNQCTTGIAFAILKNNATYGYLDLFQVDGLGNTSIGGTLSLAGALTLPADPTTALQAATKQYVDNRTTGAFTGTVTTASNGALPSANTSASYGGMGWNASAGQGELDLFCTYIGGEALRVYKNTTSGYSLVFKVDGLGSVYAAAAFIGVSASVTGAITSGSAAVSGKATVGQLQGSGSTPTVVAGTGAGTSPTLTVAGTDVAGTITLKTGTSPTAAAVALTLTFATSRSSAPYVVISPFCTSANAAAQAAAALTGAQQVYVSSSASSFAINTNATALAANTTYQWSYIVIQ